MNFENAVYSHLAVEVPILWGKEILNNVLYENSNTININLKESCFFYL